VLSKLRGRTNTNGHPVGGSSNNGHGAHKPATDLVVSSDFGWSLVVRHESELVGSMRGEEHWKNLLRELDPELDEATFKTVNGSSRTSMTDAEGHPINADSVFEEAFGLG
jgi:hypothetical protein